MLEAWENYRGQENNKEDEEVMNKRKKMNLAKFKITTVCNAKPTRHNTLYSLWVKDTGFNICSRDRGKTRKKKKEKANLNHAQVSERRRCKIREKVKTWHLVEHCTLRKA